MEEILKTCPRHEPANPRGYTPMQLEEKKRLVKKIAQENPRLPQYYIELTYDFLFTKDESTLVDMVNTNWGSGASKNPRVPIPAKNPIEIQKASDIKKDEYSREIAFNENHDNSGLL